MGSKYLGASDLKGQRPRHTIGKVDVAELKEKDGTTKRKRIVYFEGEDKALVVNKTNAVKLAIAFGKDSRDWVIYPNSPPKCSRQNAANGWCRRRTVGV
jgi:hypothetical protein